MGRGASTRGGTALGSGASPGRPPAAPVRAPGRTAAALAPGRPTPPGRAADPAFAHTAVAVAFTAGADGVGWAAPA